MTFPVAAGDKPTAAGFNAAFAVGAMVAWGQRTSNVTFVGTEIGVLRLDNVILLAGYRYVIYTSPLRVGVATGETAKLFLRMNTAGIATTSSTQIVAAEANASSAFTPAQAPVLQVTTAPGAVTASILISMARSGGSNNFTITGSTTQPIEMWVINHGLDPGDTGVDA